MSAGAGYALAFLKVCALGVAIMAAFWAVGKVAAARRPGPRETAPGDGGKDVK